MTRLLGRVRIQHLAASIYMYAREKTCTAASIVGLWEPPAAETRCEDGMLVVWGGGIGR